MPKLIYLAAPYTDPDPEVSALRAAQAAYAAAMLMSRYGFVVFSPITHWHAVVDHLPLEKAISHDFWMEQCIPVLDRCDELHILRLPGWERSRWVKYEWDFAVRMNKPIHTVDIYTLHATHTADIIIPAYPHFPKAFPKEQS